MAKKDFPLKVITSIALWMGITVAIIYVDMPAQQNADCPESVPQYFDSIPCLPPSVSLLVVNDTLKITRLNPDMTLDSMFVPFVGKHFYDVNGDREENILDLTCLVDRLYREGCE